MGKNESYVRKEVEKTVHQYKHSNKFKNREQAVAVGLSKARKNGAKSSR